MKGESWMPFLHQGLVLSSIHISLMASQSAYFSRRSHIPDPCLGISLPRPCPCSHATPKKQQNFSVQIILDRIPTKQFCVHFELSDRRHPTAPNARAKTTTCLELPCNEIKWTCTS